MKPTTRTRRLRAAAVLAAVATLAGCGVLPKNEPVALYRPEPAITAQPAWPTVPWTLKVARPYADGLHDSARILVRPEPGALQVYRAAAWIQPAPELVQDVLLRAFTDSGRVQGVTRSGEGVKARYTLLLDLRRFEADYVDGGGQPAVQVSLGARLVSTAENRIVATRVFEAAVPSSGTGVDAVNRAFSDALARVGTDVVGWTLTEGQRDAGASR